MPILLEIAKSKIHGTGVFSRSKIKKDARVFKFADRTRYINHRPGCHCKICRRCINIAENIWLYPKKDSFGWNLNHSCSPNCYARGRHIWALRDISPGEEITIDYSTTNVDKRWKMNCHCKSRNCRQVIRSIQSLPKGQFNKYKGRMPPYIEKSYDGHMR